MQGHLLIEGPPRVLHGFGSKLGDTEKSKTWKGTDFTKWVGRIVFSNNSLLLYRGTTIFKQRNCEVQIKGNNY